MNIKDILVDSISNALSDLKIDSSIIPEIKLEHPVDSSYGDFSTNVAMMMFGNAAKAIESHSGDFVWVEKNIMSSSPRELAGRISSKINESLPEEIQKVEVAGPGFINFYLSIFEMILTFLKNDLFNNIN